MIRKLSDFIVNIRVAVLVVMLALAAVCAVCSQFVEVNEDMTKYLPDSSNMKAGIDITDREFPEAEESNTIRVMFDNLDDTQKADVLARLEAIANVDSVDYDAESDDYNKGIHTLYIVNMTCDYGSDEEAAIESALESEFADYAVIWKDDDTGFESIPPLFLATALGILLAVLFVMCGSWIEPLLFLLVIGVAVVINMGTNLILGSVASVTKSIASILQLVLSMDYSIILMNRYRQERALEPNSVQAMKNALASAFSSVASSSLTTVVGLLMLVFMSFKIGANLGIVLAKGVFISMVCVLTMLPGIILGCEKLIQKTAKKPLRIPTDWAARLSYRMRHVIVPAFVLLFAATFMLQQQTGIAYTLARADQIADVFPKSNIVALVYENQDEDQMAELISSLEEDENVKSVTGYGTTLGKPYTASQLADELADADEGISLDRNVIRMLYYDYRTNGQTSPMTAADFLSFASDIVLNDQAFSDYLDDDMRDNAKEMGKFADPAALTSPKTAAGLASFFEIDVDTVKQMLVYYYATSDDYNPGKMTLPAFVNFLQDDLANDPTYGSYLDKSAKQQVKQLSGFTGKKALRAKRSAAKLALLLGIDESLVQTIFVLHNAQDVSDKTMTLAEFTSFLTGGLLDSPLFGASFDDTAREQLETLDALVQLAASGEELASEQMAQAIGMDAQTVEQLYYLYFSQQADFQQEVAAATMSLQDFLVLLQANATDEQTAQLAQMERLISLATSGQELDAAALAQVTGMDEAQIGMIFASQDPAAEAMALPAFLEAVLPLSPDNEQLAQLNQLVQLAASGAPLGSEALAQAFGIQEDQVNQLFGLTLIPQKAVSLADFTAFLVKDVLGDAAYADSFTEEQQTQLATMNRMAQLAASGTGLSAKKLANALDMEKGTAEIVLRLYFGSDISGKKMSLAGLVSFVLGDSVMRQNLDKDQLAQLKTMQRLIRATLNDTKFTYRGLADLLGMDREQLKMLFTIRASQQGGDAWAISVQRFIDFLLDDVLSNDEFANKIDADTAANLSSAKTLVDAVVSGRAYTAAEMGELLGGLADNLDRATIELMYLYAESGENANPKWMMTLETLLDYLISDVMNDPRFASVIDDDMREKLLDLQDSLDEAKEQLVTSKYSRLVVDTVYPDEGAQTTEFIAGLERFGATALEGEFYLVGNSVMNYEMQSTFGGELLFITLLTALAIFAIVALTFRSLSIPLILVLLVQCGVYITVTITGILSGSIYYLALLIVECILLGATVDYGILFTNYYRVARATAGVEDTLRAAYAGSVRTILTSGLILVLVTAAVGGMFENPTITAIVNTISLGALCVTILILFVLPGLLAACDRFVAKK